MGRDPLQVQFSCWKTPPVTPAEELKAAEESVKEVGEAAASAAAAEQVRLKKRKLLEIEQESGRMGGDTGRRIMYDDAAIERLLDRWGLLNLRLTLSDVAGRTMQIAPHPPSPSCVCVGGGPFAANPNRCITCHGKLRSGKIQCLRLKMKHYGI